MIKNKKIKLHLDIINDHNLLDIPSENQILNWLCSVLNYEKITKASVSITYLLDDEMKKINFQFRNKQKSTNILSFPFDPPPGLPDNILNDNFLGDLIICPSILVKEAAEQEKLLNNHQAHIFIHGLLHLLGYDHIEPSEQKTMETIEINLLKQFDIPNPYDSEAING